MKLLILCPGKLPKSVEDISCFTDLLNYYLPTALEENIDSTIIQIPLTDGEELKKVFSTIDVEPYDAIITLSLRFYSKISLDTSNLLRGRFDGIFCQVHDGTRLDYDPVDITFTFKDDTDRMSVNRGWSNRHLAHNRYMGWAADPEINVPNQDPKNLRILVDHTNYGGNEIDETKTVLYEIKRLVDSGIWKEQYDSIFVRRFDSGKVVDVDFDDIENIVEYDRTAIPITEISKEHSEAHIFCVTHPESVGIVVLETSLAGALTVSPKGFIQQDRLDTVRSVEWENQIPWMRVLSEISPKKSRNKAIKNSWDAVAKNIVNELRLYKEQEK